MSRSPATAGAPAMVGVVALLSLTACRSGDAGGGATATVRDSAGITLVENPAPAEVPAWRVDSVPEVDVGVVEGERPYVLSTVRSVLRLSDGRIVVADYGSRELRYFGAEGSHLASAGGEGEGPGEFTRLDAARRIHGDSVVAWEIGSGRVSIFDEQGTYVRSFTPEPPREGLFLRVASVFPGGRLLVRASEPGRAADVRTGVDRSVFAYWLYSTAGAPADSLLRLAGDESYLWRYELSGRRAFLSLGVPFGRASHLATGGDAVYTAASHRCAYRVVGLDRTVRRIVRWPCEERPVTSADVEASVERQLASVQQDEWRNRMRRAYDELPEHPETMPSVADLHVDDAGRVWVQAYVPPEEREGSRWLAFGPEGRLRATLRLPARFTPRRFGDGWVLGTWADELDVQHVRLYRVRSG